MKQIFILMLGLATLGSCVSSKKYKDLEAQMNDLRNSMQAKLNDCEDQKNKMADDCNMKTGKLQSELTERDAKVKSLMDQIDMFKKTNTNLLDRLADMSVVNKAGAESIRKSLDALNEKDRQISSLNKTMASKDSMMLSLVMNLKKSLDGVSSEDVNIEVKKGVVFISLSDKMLFHTASAVVNANAGKVLEKIATVLNDHKDISILVEGHTDNVPMSNDCIVDNWDLSTKRATSVVRLLQSKYKVDPARMTAGGRSFYDQKEDNSTSAGRQKNRRTEIVILPKLDQFFEMVKP